MTSLFRGGCVAGVAGSDLQSGMTYPGVDEVEAKTAPIPCQFPETRSLPGAVKGSGAESTALARGKAWKQSGFGMSL